MAPEHEDWAGRRHELALLENITFYIRDLSEGAHCRHLGRALELRLQAELREPLSRCLDATADVLRAWEEGEIISANLDSANDDLAAVTDSRDTGSAALTPVAAVVLDVQRLLAALRHRLCPDGTNHPD
ncbi:hypothetical protein [Arthrobacter glacialis]|uniref:hypothetical protein n=1 Tax=Arthrobacter glacialis TaxID=1664 RepID=UPI00105702E7|nr:hypothetical protein [Arthrobacter glacialis]